MIFYFFSVLAVISTILDCKFIYFDLETKIIENISKHLFNKEFFVQTIQNTLRSL